VLKQAGLIEREVDARWRMCQLQTRERQTAHDWLAQYRRFWEAGLDRLTEWLEGRAPAPAKGGAPPLPAGPRAGTARATAGSTADGQGREAPTTPTPRKKASGHYARLERPAHIAHTGSTRWARRWR
jgi:hypothetical protein